MASIRTEIENEACRLAAAHHADGLGDDHQVLAAVIERLQRMLRFSDQPEDLLRWAWRSQLARYVDSGSQVDGLAAIYLHAALLDLQHANRLGVPHEPALPVRG